MSTIPIQAFPFKLRMALYGQPLDAAPLSPEETMSFAIVGTPDEMMTKVAVNAAAVIANMEQVGVDDHDGARMLARLKELADRFSLADTDLQAFWRAQSEWSQATFGTDAERGPIGPLKHLAKEVAETLANPTDLSEYTDMLFLVFDSTRRAGFTFEQLRDAAWAKLEVNKARTWAKPVKGDEAVEHVRD